MDVMVIGAEFSGQGAPRQLNTARPHMFRKEFLEAGDTWGRLRHKVRRGRLAKADYGIYWNAQRDTASAEQALLIALTADSSRVVSHQTAAAMWGLTDRPVKKPLHISGPAAGRVKRPGRVISHGITVPEEFVRILDGVPVVNPAWAWLDVALRLSEREAVVLADRALHRPRTPRGRGEPLASREDLWKVIRARGSVRGIRGARQAAELATNYSDSPQESRLRFWMYQADLPIPRVNPVIQDASGRLRFQPDLALDEFLVAIQYEGVEFHSSPEAVRSDVRRAEVAEELGWVEVRITKDHMRGDGARALAKIKKVLRSRGWPG